MKNKRGFTLVEIMITVGIIVIVAAAGTIGVVISLRRSKEKAANLSAGAQNFESEAIENLGQLNANNEYVPPVQTKLPEDTATPTPGPGTVTPTVEPTAGPSSAPTSAPTTAPTVTQAPTSAPTSAPTTAPTSGGSGGASNSAGTVSSSSTVSGTDGSVGVVSISSSSNPSVTVSQGWNNNCTFTLTKNSNGTYTMSNISQKWVVGSIHDIWSSDSIVLNDSDMNYLNNTFGLKIG